MSTSEIKKSKKFRLEFVFIWPRARMQIFSSVLLLLTSELQGSLNNFLSSCLFESPMIDCVILYVIVSLADNHMNYWFNQSICIALHVTQCVKVPFQKLNTQTLQNSLIWKVHTSPVTF